MAEQKKIENVIVYKQRPAGDDRGILTPVLIYAAWLLTLSATLVC